MCFYTKLFNLNSFALQFFKDDLYRTIQIIFLLRNFDGTTWWHRIKNVVLELHHHYNEKFYLRLVPFDVSTMKPTKNSLVLSIYSCSAPSFFLRQIQTAQFEEKSVGQIWIWICRHAPLFKFLATLLCWVKNCILFRLGSAWTAFSRSSDPSKTPDSLRSDVGSVKSDIDANLWLTCRIKMVEYLFCEENSVGRIAGFSRSVVAVTGSAEQQCEQGLDESDAFGHSEIVAQFQFSSLLLKLKSGSLTQDDFHVLKVWAIQKKRFFSLAYLKPPYWISKVHFLDVLQFTIAILVTMSSFRCKNCICYKD